MCLNVRAQQPCYVCAYAAAIYCVNGDLNRAKNAIDKINVDNKRFSVALMEQLFSLKDPDKHRAMIGAFERLGPT